MINVKKWQALKVVGIVIAVVGVAVMYAAKYVVTHRWLMIPLGIVLVVGGIALYLYADYNYKQELYYYYNELAPAFFTSEKKPINLKSKFVGKAPYKYEHEGTEYHVAVNENGLNEMVTNER